VSKIKFVFEDVKKIVLKRDLLKRYAEYLVNNEKKELGNVTVIFCSDDYLLKINEEYLGHNYFTDIITFDYSENSLISGDLFISLERIAENASEFSTTFKKELARVFFHGLLHLCGYKDKTHSEQLEMREKEDFYLKGIEFDKEGV
jgi:probable rRNA maturation factor